MNRTTDSTRLSLWRLPAMQLLAVYTLVGFTGMFATMSALPAWLADGGTSTSIAGLVTTTLLVTTIAAQSAVPALTRRFGLATVLGAGCVFLGLPSLGLLHDGGLWWVLAISAVRGIGFGAITVLGSMLTARVAPPERRGEAIGIYGLAIAVPNVAAVAGGVALVSAGYFPIVALLGAVPLLGLVTVRPLERAAGPDPDAQGAPANAAEVQAVRRSRQAARMAALGPAVVLMVVTLTSSGFLTYLPIVRPHGALASVAILVWGITESVARWGVGPLADRIGLRQLLPGASATNIVGILLVALGLTAAGTMGTVILAVGAAILGVGFGAVQNLTLLAAFEQARQRETATVSAVWNIGFDAGTGSGAALVGPLMPWLGPAGAIAAPALLVAASSPLAIRAGRPPSDR